MLQRWRVQRESGTPRRPTMTWEEDGWDVFHRTPGLLPYEQLEDLGFLTQRAIQALRDACGDDYSTLQLIVDVAARGPTWLPRIALGDANNTEAYAFIHQHFVGKLREIAGLNIFSPGTP